jgi:hypothetical protein
MKNAVAANFRVYLKPGVSGESRKAKMMDGDAIAEKKKNPSEVTACHLVLTLPRAASGR